MEYPTTGLKFVDGELNVRESCMRRCVDKAVVQTVECIQELLQEFEAEHVEAPIRKVLLLGGFANSEYLRAMMKDFLKTGLKSPPAIMRLEDTGHLVCQGALAVRDQDVLGKTAFGSLAHR